ncbi:MAG: hypothetical protein V4713_03590 [Pseudomonadota bacterium]
MSKKFILRVMGVLVILSLLSIVGYGSWADSQKEELAIQTLGLRKNAHLLFASVPVPNKDVTQIMIAAMAVNSAPDQRFEKAMRELWVDDGFSKGESPKRLMIGKMVEVRILGKEGEFYVQFIGVSPKVCDGVTFAICS